MGESSNSGHYQKLPPGWDCKFDQATGNCYYINYFTKAMQLEDPRIRYKQLQNEHCSTESIPLQPLHGSPYHVYPSNNLPAMRAFQTGPATQVHSTWQHMSSSPLLSSRGNLEMSPLPFPKLATTQTPRTGNMSRRSTIQETSFSNHIDTDAVVTKIQNMFPTASENHIRLLLRRYYNREAVVISALQVEKHPVTMPGPFVTPPAQRHLFHSNSAFQMTPPSRRLDTGHSVGHSIFGGGSGTSRTASPLPGGRFGSVISMNSSNRAADIGGHGGVSGVIGVGCNATANGFVGQQHGIAAFGYPTQMSSVLFHGSPRFGEQWRSSPKPHSSPKMKLRYMKNIFPKADEMLLLDVLANADNNVQKASQTLISMGYAKREFVPQKPINRLGLNADGAGCSGGVHSLKTGDEKIIPLHPKEYTQEEKDAMQQRLKEKYAQIAERIIIMALESVNYSEDRAIQILQIVQDEETATRTKAQAQLIGDGIDESRSNQGLPISILQCEADSLNLRTAGSGGNAVDNIITVVVEETLMATNKKSDLKIENIKNIIESMPDESENFATTLTTSTSTSSTTTTTTSLATTTTTSTLSASSSSLYPKNPLTLKKRGFPSINLTTPTTATTQIILSNSPIFIENDMATTDDFITQQQQQEQTTKTQIDGHDKNKNENTTNNNNNNKDSTETETEKLLKIDSCMKDSIIAIPSSLSLNQPKRKSHSSSSQLQSSSPTSWSFETLTTKSMLARFSNTTKRGHHSYCFDANVSASASTSGTASLLEKLKLSSRPRDKFDTLKYTQRDYSGDELDVCQQHDFQSLLGRISTMGPDNELSKGPDEGLLLADYVTWNGANPDISIGQKYMATGSDSTLLGERNYVAQGRNVELCKGAKVGLAKGSIYAQLSAAKNSKSTNIKCN